MNYDNTGEESVYMLAEMFNNDRLMAACNMKTRADRGVQPLWYQNGVPVTIDGEDWWQFQYTTSLADIGMNNWLVSQNNGMTQDEMGLAERANYAAKLGNLAQINTGQIDPDPANIGAVSWTYQQELGNWPQPNKNSIAKAGVGDLHNGWRQTSGEGDLALFGALQVLSADVANDPIFGLVGYGAEVKNAGSNYDITPTDGLYQRLNLVNDQYAYDLGADQYTHATISKDHQRTTFAVKNVAKQAHQLTLSITNPHPDNGTYDVLWNGQKVGTVKENQRVTRINVKIGTQDGQLTIAKQAPTAIPDQPSQGKQGQQVIEYVNANGHVVGQQVLTGKVGQTLKFSPQLPEGWVLAVNVPATIMIKDQQQAIRIAVKQQASQPGQGTTPTDSVDQGSGASQQAGIAGTPVTNQQPVTIAFPTSHDRQALPQTGSQKGRPALVLGLLLTSFASLFGFSKRARKH